MMEMSLATYIYLRLPSKAREIGVWFRMARMLARVSVETLSITTNWIFSVVVMSVVDTCRGGRSIDEVAGAEVVGVEVVEAHEGVTVDESSCECTEVVELHE